MARLTPTSVACAERTTATSRVKRSLVELALRMRPLDRKRRKISRLPPENEAVGFSPRARWSPSVWILDRHAALICWRIKVKCIAPHGRADLRARLVPHRSSAGRFPPGNGSVAFTWLATGSFFVAGARRSSATAASISPCSAPSGQHSGRQQEKSASRGAASRSGRSNPGQATLHRFHPSGRFDIARNPTTNHLHGRRVPGRRRADRQLPQPRRPGKLCKGLCSGAHDGAPILTLPSGIGWCHGECTSILYCGQ